MQRVGCQLVSGLDRVCVDVAGRADRGMAEPLRYRLDVGAGCDQQRCVCVPLRYNNDKPEKPRIFKGFQGFKPDF